MNVTASKAVVRINRQSGLSREAIVRDILDDKHLHQRSPVHPGRTCELHKVSQSIARIYAEPNQRSVQQSILSLAPVTLEAWLVQLRRIGLPQSAAGTVLRITAARLHSRIAQSFQVHWSNQWLTLWD